VFLLSRFCWDVEGFKPDFSIYPIQGYITPGMEVTFEVFFHPQEINQDIRYDVSTGETNRLIEYKDSSQISKITQVFIFKSINRKVLTI